MKRTPANVRAHAVNPCHFPDGGSRSSAVGGHFAARSERLDPQHLAKTAASRPHPPSGCWRDGRIRGLELLSVSVQLDAALALELAGATTVILGIAVVQILR